MYCDYITQNDYLFCSKMNAALVSIRVKNQKQNQKKSHQPRTFEL